MSHPLTIKSDVRVMLDPSVASALERAILDDAFTGKESDRRAQLLHFTAVSCLPQGETKGRLLNDIYNANASAFLGLSAWSKELRAAAGIREMSAPVAQPRQDYDDEVPSRSAHAVLLPRSPRRFGNGQDPDREQRRRQLLARYDQTEREDPSTPEDESFASEFRAAHEGEDAMRALAVQQREEVAAKSDPTAETASIMEEENPYARVLRAARTVRTGARIDKSGLYFLKK